MILTKFNFSTLIFSALLTFNINATICTPSENDEFDEEISQQEGADPSIEEEVMPTESEYVSSVEENVSSVAAETSELLEDAVMDTAMITAEEAVAVLGVIGIVVVVGIMVYRVVTVFSNPASTTKDKVITVLSVLSPVADFFSTIVNDFGLSPGDKARKKVDDALSDATTDRYSYKVNTQETSNLDSLVSKIEKHLTDSINNTSSIRGVRINYDQILLRHYAEKYLLTAKNMYSSLPNIYARQWMKASPDFIALDNALESAVKGEKFDLPDIISSKTRTLCGINDNDDNDSLSLSNKSANQVKRCVNGIFYDYKTHFSAYSLDDLITISTPDLGQTPPVEVVKSTTFRDFLVAYAGTYNHFLSTIKVSYASGIYKEKARVERMICVKQKTAAEDFLVKAKANVWSLASLIFSAANNIDGSGRSKAPICWDGKRYMCSSYIKYNRSKDPSVPLALDKIDTLQVLIDDAYNSCTEGEYDGGASHGALIYALNTDRFYPMLDKGDTAKLFTNIFRGVKTNLVLSVKQKLKILYESKKQK